MTNPVVVSMTSFQKTTLSLVPKDVNGNIIAIAAPPSYSVDNPALLSLANATNPGGNVFTVDVLGNKNAPQGSGGTVNVSARFTPIGGSVTTEVIATVNVSIDPREPGPFDHFAVSASAPVDQ